MSQQWREELALRLASANKIAALGIGSQLMSDDAAGMLLIESLQQRGLASENMLLLAGSTAPENFTGLIRNFAPDLLLVVDAARMGLAPGSIAVLAPEAVDEAGFSTHMLPFSVMLRYLQVEGTLDVLLLGIEPVSMDFGFEICVPVKAAVEELAGFLEQRLT